MSITFVLANVVCKDLCTFATQFYVTKINFLEDKRIDGSKKKSRNFYTKFPNYYIECKVKK